MEIDAMIEQAQSRMTAQRVYGDPVERDGVTVIPAAKVMGGGGAGTDESAEGGGAGFGITARPAGALIIEPGGKVRWKGFFDLNRAILGGQIVGIAFFITLWLARRSEARAAMKATIATAAINRVGHTPD